MRRSAFTMIELLVVMTVILILTGILIPVIGMVRRQAKDVQCTHNLQQLGIGITAFQQSNNNMFPESLSQMFASGQPLSGESMRVLLCPHDATKGGDMFFNRSSLNNSNTSELYDPTHTFAYPSMKHSYMFEAANVALDHDAVAQAWFDPGSTTWAAAKVHQLKHGGPGGNPYRPEDFPILRCFWHSTFTDANKGTNKKVLNLTWAMTTKWTAPWWEKEFNP